MTLIVPGLALSDFTSVQGTSGFWTYPKISLIETERKDKTEEKASRLRGLAVRARGPT